MYVWKNYCGDTFFGINDVIKTIINAGLPGREARQPRFTATFSFGRLHMHFTLPQLFESHGVAWMSHKRFLHICASIQKIYSLWKEKEEERKNIKYSINIATTVFHSPLRKLHCYQYRAYLMLHLSSPALTRVASFSSSLSEYPQHDLLLVRGKIKLEK